MPPDDVADRVRAALVRFDGVRPAVEAGAPWPLAERFDDAPEALWGPPEVLAHVEEMLGFWRTELERVAAGDGEPVPFGRTADDVVRLSAIEHDRSLPPTELFSRVVSGADRFLAAWDAWTPEERRRVGLHPRLGEMTVEASAERFIVGHLTAHADQLEATLASGSTGD